MTLSVSIKILYFLGLDLSLTLPFAHSGLFVLHESGFFSYKMGMFQLESWAILCQRWVYSNHLSDIFSISVSCWIFDGHQLLVRFVLYLQPFRISLGLLLIPGMSVAWNISMASQVLSAFLVIICFMVCTICSTLPTD